MPGDFVASVRNYLKLRQTDLSKSLAQSEANIGEFANVVASEKDRHLKQDAQTVINGLRKELAALQEQDKPINTIRSTVLGDRSTVPTLDDDATTLEVQIASDMAWYLTSSTRLKSLRNDITNTDHEIWDILDPFIDFRPPVAIVLNIHNKKETDSFDSGTTRVHEAVFNQALYTRLLYRTGMPRRSDPIDHESVVFNPDNEAWEKGKEIGRGAFGTVSVVFRPSSKTVLVMKEVRMLSMNQRLRDQVQRECDILQLARHPNIVALAAFRETGEVVQIFMEYISGGTIAGIIKHTGRLAEAEAKPILRQVLAGLIFLHERSIVHRDIKGANILVRIGGCVKIGDLGSARLLDEVQYDRDRSLRPSVAGTVYWMSPEVLRRSNYSTLADIWSVGCLTVEMLSGKHPWYREPRGGLAATIPENAILRVGQGETPPLRPDLSKAAVTMFSKIFVKADQRISAQALLRDPWVTA